jgi:hypothetical protein
VYVYVLFEIRYASVVLSSLGLISRLPFFRVTFESTLLYAKLSAPNVAICDGNLCEDGGCDVESALKRSLPDGAHHLEERVPTRQVGAATQKDIALR